MKLIPMPKSITLHEGSVDLTTPDVRVMCGNDVAAENYTLDITPEAVTITADGERGVFYAKKTLAQLAATGESVPCMTINDAPDFAYRGFYQDVSRGRIPKLATLKRLVDRLSEWKINSLQLYIEHTHRFAEYVGINDDRGYYTDEEIRKLDAYCRERCVELVPSLSSFGHLYYLLQSEKYRHLCEMPDYQPTRTEWHERLLHHTIDPKNPESLALITSLIAQYEPLFTSKYFNICCDETFDLCKGRNAGGDVAATYAAFVAELAAFLRERGKTVMMWGDIVMKHPEAFDALPDDIVYLNWCYDANGGGLHAEVLAERGKPQIVCPSVHTHKRLLEKLEYSLPNIRVTAQKGLEHGAKGVLVTNWGDYGHLCPDENMQIGLAYAGAVMWNVSGTDDADFETAVSSLVYGIDDDEVIDIVRTLGKCDELFLDSFGYEKALWELTVQFFDNEYGTPLDYDRHKADLQKLDLAALRATCQDCAMRLRELMLEVPIYAFATLFCAARGMALIFGLLDDACHGRAYSDELLAERDEWLADFRVMWMMDNQEGEWDAIETFFTENMMR